MASIVREIPVASATAAWDALVDFGAVDRRVVPGFVTDCELDGGDRIVTFANGAQARERLVAVDHDRRRLVYAVVESGLGFVHHQASVEVVDGPDGARLVWTSDLLPDDLAPMVEGLMTAGAVAMERTLGG